MTKFKISLLFLTMFITVVMAACGGGSKNTVCDEADPECVVPPILDVNADMNNDGIYDIVQPEVVEGMALPSGVYLSDRKTELRSESGEITSTEEETYNAERTVLTHTEYDADGFKIEYEETKTDSAGRESETSRDYDVDGVMDYTKFYTYDANGDLSQYRYYDIEEARDIEFSIYKYDEHHQAIEVSTNDTNSDGSVTTNITSYTYTYDEKGHEIASEMSENGIKEFSYTATFNGDLPLISKYVYYHEDGALSWENTENYTFTFNDKNQLIGSTSELYDGFAQEVTQEQKNTYTYDDKGNLATHETDLELWGKDASLTIDNYTYDTYGYHTGYLQTIWFDNDENGAVIVGDDKFQVYDHKTYVNTYSDGTVSSTTDIDVDGFILGFDCDDSNVHAFSSFAFETCDGFDNNCDGQIDESLTVKTYYRDADGDGYSGDPSNTISSCIEPDGYSSSSSVDCDDDDATVKSASSYGYSYPDVDVDGFGTTGGATYVCPGTVGYADNHDDCNDDDATIGDESTAYLYPDSDLDSLGASTGGKTVCESTAGYVDNHDDCDDDDAAIGDVDTAYLYPDADSDGHGDSSKSGEMVCIGTLNHVDSNDDCNDSDPTVYPGHLDLKFYDYGDGVDNDCDGTADDGVISWTFPPTSGPPVAPYS